METNVYYRPEAELVLQHYLPLMESELLRDPTRRSLRKVYAMMEDQRVRHVSHVNEVRSYNSNKCDVHSLTPPSRFSLLITSRRVSELPPRSKRGTVQVFTL